MCKRLVTFGIAALPRRHYGASSLNQSQKMAPAMVTALMAWLMSNQDGHHSHLGKAAVRGCLTAA